MKNHRPQFYKKESETCEKFFSRQWFINYSLILIGALLLAIGYSLFIVPKQIVPGGVTGLSIMINHLTQLPVGMLSFIINIPLFILGIRVLGTKFGLKSFVALILSSGLIDLILYFTKQKAITQDPLVCAIFGGALIGLGIALVLKAGATTGGTDIIARLLARALKVSVGRMFLVVDGLIVISSILVFRSLDLAPYCIIAIFAISRTVDAIFLGLDQKKAVIVVSERIDDIRKIILDTMDRGGTYLLGKGLYYEEQDKKIIFTVLSRKEMVLLQTHVREIDPDAFLTVLDTREVIGSGFKPF